MSGVWRRSGLCFDNYAYVSQAQTRKIIGGGTEGGRRFRNIKGTAVHEYGNFSTQSGTGRRMKASKSKFAEAPSHETLSCRAKMAPVHMCISHKKRIVKKKIGGKNVLRQAFA